MDVSAIPNNISPVLATDGNLIGDNRRTLYSAAAETTYTPIAEAIGHDKSFVSRVLSKRPPENPAKLDIDEWLAFIGATELVLVRKSDLADSCVVSKEVWASVLRESALYRVGLSDQAGK